MACLTDRDCPGNLICYNTSWNQYAAQCLCSTWFGLQGPDCSDYFGTDTARWRVITSFLLIFGWAYGLFRGLFDGLRLFRRSKDWSVTLTCEVQLVIGCSLAMLSEIFGQVNQFHPDVLTTYLVGTNMKTVPLFYSKQILTTLGYCSIFLALATMPFHWRELANQAFRPNKRKLTYLKPLVVFEILFSTIVLVFVALSMPSLAYISAIPFVFCVIVAYGLCGVALYRVLIRVAANQQHDQQKGRFIKSARNVAATSMQMFFVGSLVLILNLVFAITSAEPAWREHSPVGRISTPVVVGTILNVVLLMAALLGQAYLSATIKATISRLDGVMSTTGSRNQGQSMLSMEVAVLRVLLCCPDRNVRDYGSAPSHDNKQVMDDSAMDTPSAQPDSIVTMNDPKEIKKKQKLKAKKREPELTAITDMSVDQTTTNNPTYVGGFA